MPRDRKFSFCDRCSRVMKVPGRGKGSPGAVAVGAQAETEAGTVVWCQVCVNRHGLPSAVETLDRLEARDAKESPKDDRPVRRPSRPRPRTRNLMDPVASASAPQIAQKWAAEMPGPAPIRRPTVEEKYGKPAPAPITVAEARAKQKAFAEAYAMKHGRLMAPPTRRGIVPAEEISAAVDAVGGETLVVPEDGQLLTSDQAATYLGVSLSTFSKWKKLYGCPIAARTDTGLNRSGVMLYRVEDLEELMATAEQARSEKARASAEYAMDARAGAVSTRLDDLHRLLVEGMSREDAVKVAGYSSVPSARAAASGAGRDDVRAMLRTQFKPSRAEVEERISTLEELLANGDALGDAWRRVGWTARADAERSLDRHGRHDLSLWLRTGVRPLKDKGRAA